MRKTFDSRSSLCARRRRPPGTRKRAAAAFRRPSLRPLGRRPAASHTLSMADVGAEATRRIFIEDVRRNDAYLRATWHPETRVLVVSHWTGDMCTASTPISVNDAGKLIGLLVTALEGAAMSSVQIEPSPPVRRASWHVALLKRFRGVRRAAARSFPVHQLRPRSSGSDGERRHTA